MTKGTNGVWEVTVGPVDPGAYRYNFNVDGVTVIDPRNPGDQRVQQQCLEPGVCSRVSSSWIPADVPHGAVAAVTYYSKTLGPLPAHARLHAAGI